MTHFIKLMLSSRNTRQKAITQGIQTQDTHMYVYRLKAGDELVISGFKYSPRKKKNTGAKICSMFCCRDCLDSMEMSIRVNTIRTVIKNMLIVRIKS